MAVDPLPPMLYEQLVRNALAEDLGIGGDLTSDALIDVEATATTALVSRQAGIVAGLAVASAVFRALDPEVTMRPAMADGTKVGADETLATVRGRARAILTAERTALNFVGHLSGIATATAEIVRAVSGTRAWVCCTRKTLPGMRALQKYAVRAGGGRNHRLALDGAVLIKDNHVALAGGVAPAVRRARDRIGHLVKIQVEVDSLCQLAEVPFDAVDAVLLDNFSVDALTRAVELVAGRVTTEASGGITPSNAGAIAATGVDVISLGWLTHSVRHFDVGLDMR